MMMRFMSCCFLGLGPGEVSSGLLTTLPYRVGRLNIVEYSIDRVKQFSHESQEARSSAQHDQWNERW